MIKLSELISKPVISIYDCELLGIVYNALFDKKTKTLKYLIVLDEENDIEYTLETKQIISSSKDAIIIKNNKSLDLKQNIDMELSTLENIALKPIYSIDGINYGIIKDIILNDKYKLQEVETPIANLCSANIVKINKIAIVSNQKVSINRYKPKPQFVLSENYSVEITSPKLPAKATINEGMLLNRTVYHTISDANKNVLIKQNTIITNQIIDMAKKHGKLKELIRYSF